MELRPGDALALAERAAREAAALLLARWRRPGSVVTKSSLTDPVSDADREAEERIVALLRAARPGDAIVAEEGSSGEAAGRGAVRWLVDPLDGTVNYLYGIPHWAVSVAALDTEGALAGVVYDPVRDELYRASRGGGAWLGRVPLATTALAAAELALVATGYSYVAAEREEQARREGRFIGRVRDVRRFGSAALDLAYVAAGRVDAYYESFGNPWDWAAGALLVSEAGGQVSEVAGVRTGTPGMLASGRPLHDALLAIVGVQGPTQPLDLSSR